jgi:hypothetical protein
LEKGLFRALMECRTLERFSPVGHEHWQGFLQFNTNCSFS